MVTYTEKGTKLHEVLANEGFVVQSNFGNVVCKRVDGAPVTIGDESAIQLIIDTYDPLPTARQEAKQRLIDQFNVAMSVVEDAFPEAEKRTFTKQETEARAFALDNTASTPTLTAIASVRGVTVEYLSGRVIEKADAYTSQVGALMGLRQVLEDQIDAETDWQVIQQINLGI